MGPNDSSPDCSVAWEALGHASVCQLKWTWLACEIPPLNLRRDRAGQEGRYQCEKEVGCFPVQSSSDKEQNSGGTPGRGKT